MTREEYYKNYKLSCKLSLMDITWVVFMVATGLGLIALGRRGLLDSWIFMIPVCLVWAIIFSILMNWLSEKKRLKYNLLCSVCQHDLSHSVSMTIITGKCQKCGCDLFDKDVTLDLPPYVDKTKMQLLEFRRKMSKQIWMLFILWVISFIVLLFLTFYFNSLTITIVGGFMSTIILSGVFFIAFLESLQARKEGFICPKCNNILCHSRMEIAIKTGKCSKCGKRLFEDR
jgi:hypothetical protein